ncbi:MAG: nuclear transport factor 2 family protein [Proteobacteria bacterium]|nr:nuclear transport factor 2 family protein [Pseudomonadota bacterium]
MAGNASEMDLIARTVQLYFEGMYHSDVGKLKEAFHSDAFLTGNYEGSYARLSVGDWLGMIEKTPAPSQNGEVYDMNVVSVDINQTVASVKVKDLYLGLRFTDYLSLMKIDGKWKIVSKVFYHKPRS